MRAVVSRRGTVRRFSLADLSALALVSVPPICDLFLHTPRVTTLHGVMRMLFWLLPLPFLACSGAANRSGGDDTPSGNLCSNTCQFANDGQCDDGGPGADFNDCTYGSDCG